MVEREIGLTSHAGRARQRMRITVWKHEDVSRRRVYGRLSVDRAPAAAMRDHVVGDEMPGIGKDLPDDHFSWWRRGNPRVRGIDIEENDASKTHRPQHIRQRIH